MIAGINTRQVAVVYSGTVDGTVPAFVAPWGGATIKNAYGFVTAAVTAHATNTLTLNLLNGGTVGTATTAIGTAGGTVGIAANTKTAFSMNSALATLTEGQVLMVKFDWNGSITPGDQTVIVEWVQGKG
jgi:hypothetical protein